ncbi:small multi-drug export protein [Candidatus Pacearchaeota archaeon]|nr:small multi-drug export protein [Candidatus Pacearchaeota archaeon]
MNQIILAIILTLLPIVELRGGLPVALLSASKENISPILVFAVIVLFNILLIFAIFFFLDYFHKIFLKFEFYKKFYSFYLTKMQKKIDKFEKAHNSMGIFALFLFVAIPLPLTGAYSGVFLSWIMGLKRKKSILAISLGVLTSGIIIYIGTMGITSFLG